MGYFDIFLQNKILVEAVYTIIILSICIAVIYRTRKFYHLSSYKAIKYFSDAFLSFSVAFLSRFLIMLLGVDTLWIKSAADIVLSLVFYYTLSLAGFYLVYSLVWKNFLQRLSWKKEGLLHAAAVLVSFLTFFSDNMSILFITQLAVLGYAIVISYSNYNLSKRNTFRQLFFIAMVLAFVGYLANFLSMFIEPFYPPYVLYVYAITTTIFLIVLYGAYNG